MSNYAPWYVIVWRLIWFIPHHLTLILFCLVVVFAYGPQIAFEVFEENRMH